VPVISYGQSEFPAFWSRKSGIQSPMRSDSTDELAASHIMRKRLGIPGGQLIANPVPQDLEIPAGELFPLILQAQHDAEAIGIAGKEVTPFLLNRLFELTEGACLKTNVALIIDNARVAAKIAVALKKITDT